jgi:AcrR family transcriptional regulator
VPRLWSETIEAHRREVRETIMETALALVAERGPLSVTMSQVATETGIGRATLYKYFPDVEAILTAGHELHISAHLAQLTELRHGDAGAGERLEAVLRAYARICHYRERHGGRELGALLHRGESVVRAEQQLLALFRDLLVEVADAGGLRTDVPTDELATFCLHALTAAGSLPSEDAAGRLVDVTLAALRPPE